MVEGAIKRDSLDADPDPRREAQWMKEKDSSAGENERRVPPDGWADNRITG